MEKTVEEVKILQDNIIDSLKRFQLVEDTAEILINQACDSGYRMGWYDGIKLAAENLRQKGYSSSAEIIEKIIALADLEEA